MCWVCKYLHMTITITLPARSQARSLDTDDLAGTSVLYALPEVFRAAQQRTAAQKLLIVACNDFRKAQAGLRDAVPGAGVLEL
jgi:hypothetical protein